VVPKAPLELPIRHVRSLQRSSGTTGETGFNLRVDGFRIYCEGQLGAWVQNACAPRARNAKSGDQVHTPYTHRNDFAKTERPTRTRTRVKFGNAAGIIIVIVPAENGKLEASTESPQNKIQDFGFE
jgi:hypothetical protein